jgi:hypothetical protein
LKTAEYLYDNPHFRLLSAVPYAKALELKIEWANKLISKLLEEPYETRDTTRINDCIKAIKFNEALLKEVKEG